MEINSAQLAEIINAIKALRDPIPYTITGAVDWPIIVILGGTLVGILGFMWIDLRATIKDHRGELRAELKEQVDLIWAELRIIANDLKKCKENCK